MIEKYLFNVALRKGAIAAGKAAAGFILGAKIQAIATQLGIQIDPAKLEAGLITFSVAGLEAAHDYLKFKFPNVVKY